MLPPAKNGDIARISPNSDCMYGKTKNHIFYSGYNKDLKNNNYSSELYFKNVSDNRSFNNLNNYTNSTRDSFVAQSAGKYTGSGKNSLADDNSSFSNSCAVMWERTQFVSPTTSEYSSDSLSPNGKIYCSENLYLLEKFSSSHDLKSNEASCKDLMETSSCELAGKKKCAKSSYKHIPHKDKPPHLVARRNARERRRVQAVNSAFSRLRKHIPYPNRNKRLSKVKTLKIAIDYINQLQDLIDDFDSNAAKERENYVIHEYMMPYQNINQAYMSPYERVSYCAGAEYKSHGM